MTFLRSLFLNFLIVFFVDRVIPGISIDTYGGRAPNMIDDVLFASIMALLNASIFPGLYILGFNPTNLKIAIVAFIVSFGGFFVLMNINYGVSVTNYGGLFLGGLIVFAMSFFTNILEKKQHRND